MQKRKFYTRFDPPPSKGLNCEDASLTRQEFVQEADLNNIMKRYAAGMPLPSGSRMPQFGDFSNVPDFATAFDMVQQANERFASLPSEVRKRFNNDPQELLSFVNDSKNRDEAIKLGLIEKPVVVSVPETNVEGEGK